MATRRRRPDGANASRTTQVSAGRRELPVDRAEEPTASWIARHAALLAVVGVLVLTTLVRLRLADLPLERDEGEYAYAGRLILQGIPPYVLVYNMKFPGTYAAYSVLMAIFGQTAWGIHVGLSCVNAATALALFFLGRRLVGERAAAIGAQAFAVLSLDRWIMGVWAHATHFVIFFVVTGLLVLLRAIESRRWITLACSGMLIGTAVLMKQPAAVFVPFALAYLFWAERDRAAAMKAPTKTTMRAAIRQLAVLFAGLSVPFIVLASVIAWFGLFDKFWFWAFQYAGAYVSEVPVSKVWPTFWGVWTTITRATWPVWSLGIAGFVLLWAVRWKARTRVFLGGWLFVSLLALTPGFYFRHHYFIQLLPVTALCVGAGLVSLERLLTGRLSATLARSIPLLIFAGAVGLYVAAEHDYLTDITPRQLTRSRYSVNPFVEAPEIGQYIRDHTTPDDRVVIFGSEPEIYFYAGRKSATGYIYMYPLMELQPSAPKMQDEMMAEVEAANPKYLVISQLPVSWGTTGASDMRILKWSERLTMECYELVGIADIQSLEVSTIVWDAAASTYEPRSPNLLRTFRRKTEARCSVPR